MQDAPQSSRRRTIGEPPVTLRALPAILACCAVLALAGCTHSTLGRAAFIGASATAGYGAETAGTEGPLPVDLAVAYRATVSAPTREPLRFGDGAFFARPGEAAREQIDALLRENPTIIFAIDWLFWSVYGPLRSGDEDPVSERLVRVDAALAELARLDDRRVPIALGTVPRMRSAASLRIPVDAGATEPSELPAIDHAVRSWAAPRPWVHLVPLESVFEDVVVDGVEWPLLQEDDLHPTAEGLVHLAQRALATLSDAGVIDRRSWELDVDAVRLRLAPAAERALASRRPGWLEIASAERAYDRALDALDEGDCASAAASAERLFDIAQRLDRDPSGTGFGAAMGRMLAEELVRTCPEHAIVVRRAVESLGFEARQSRPNAFRLELWVELAATVGRQDEVIERLAALAVTLSDAELAESGRYGRAYRTAASSLRGARRMEANHADDIARRARVVDLYGGSDRVLAAARVAVDEAVARREAYDRVTRRSERDEPTDAVPRIDPFPPTAAEADALNAVSSSIRRCVAYLRDLSAAGAISHAERLRRELDERVGASMVALAMGRDFAITVDRVLPGWNLSAYGRIDLDAEILLRAGATPDPRVERAMRAIVTRAMPLRVRLASTSIVPNARLAIGRLDGDGGGLFTHIDGVTIVSTPSPGGVSHAPFDPGAPDVDERFQTETSLLAGAPEWQRIEIGRTVRGLEVASLDELESLIWTIASANDVERAWPLPFIAEIDLESDTASIEARVGKAPIAVAARPVRVIGVLAPGAVGRIVRPGRAAIAHVLWSTDGGSVATAELVSITAGTLRALELPR